MALSLSCAVDESPEEGFIEQSQDALTQSTTYQRGVRGTVADAFISTNQMKVNFGGQPKLRLSAKNEALIRFDLSAIPPSAVIKSATLNLYLNGGDDEEDDDCEDGDRENHPEVPIKLHRATAAWGESTVTYANFRQQFAPKVEGIIIPTSPNSLKSVNLTSLVQGWTNSPNTNYGVLLRTTAKKHTIIVSSEGGKASLRPSLTITYATPDNHCATNPCHHGGTCQNNSTGYTCTCAAGYTGPNCDTLVDNCSGNPCLNGGSCTNDVASYVCSCAAGYTGTNCQTNINDCVPNLCQNGGVCTDGVNSYTCTCAAGYTGATCETLVNNCASEPCNNGGVCTNGVNSYSCACAPGFTGTNCDVNIDDCAGNLCQNGGTCADGVNDYTCNCAPGYTGTNCQTLVNNCVNAPCQNGGSCFNGINSYTCACAPGYTGANCETDINDCAVNPCQNDGLCVDGVNSYTCACAPGFTGVNCDVNVDDCAGNPCQNGGTCADGADSYTCTCASGFTGVNCDVNVDDCTPNPCQNGGTCADGLDSHSCTCASGFVGSNCESSVSECAPTHPFVFSENFNSGTLNPTLIACGVNNAGSLDFFYPPALQQATLWGPAFDFQVSTRFSVLGDFVATVDANRADLSSGHNPNGGPGDGGLRINYGNTSSLCANTNFSDVYFLGLGQIAANYNGASMVQNNAANPVTFRIRRVGNTVFEEYRTSPSGSFILVNSQTGSQFSGPVTINFFIQDGAGHNLRYDNFQITSSACSPP